MKKNYWLLTILIVIFLAIGFYLGWLDDGPNSEKYYEGGHQGGYRICC